MESKANVSREVTVVQLSEKDKQALQEKYKAQRQAMWSGKQSTSQESDEQAEEVDQTDAVDSTTDSTDAESSATQSDSSSVGEDRPASTETPDQGTRQDEPSVQTELDEPSVQTELEDETAPTTEDTEDVQEDEEGTSAAERVFWETDQEGGPSILTWKLVLAVIGVSIILIGVGVYLGFLFAG